MSPLAVPRAPFRWIPTILLLASFVLVSSSASALPGVGSLKKKAEKEAAKAAGVSSDSEAPVTKETVVYDDVTLELTPKILDQIVVTYDKAAAAASGRPALTDKLTKLQEERNKLWDKEGEKITKTEQERDDANGCRHEKVEEMVQAKMADYSQKALSDPAIRDKYTKIAMQYNSAIAAGDTAAVKSAQDAVLKVIMPSHEDTLAAWSQCPSVPGPLASEQKLADLDKQIADVMAELRKIDDKVAAAQAETGGMTRDQFAMAMERVQMYLSWRQSKSYSKSSTRGFSDKEIEALEEYLEKLRKALGMK